MMVMMVMMVMVMVVMVVDIVATLVTSSTLDIHSHFMAIARMIQLQRHLKGTNPFLLARMASAPVEVKST